MKTSTRIIFALSAFLIVLMLVTGCSDTSETQVKYIGPTGYVVKEIARPAETQPETAPEEPETNPGINNETTIPAANNTPPATSAQTANSTSSLPAQNQTSSGQENNGQLPSYLGPDTLQTEKADLKEVMPRICDDSQILVVGYVTCTYDNTTGYAMLTLKNNNKMPIQEVWFYITNRAQKVSYEKADGILAGETSDYALPISRWTKDYGKLDRIVVTPAIKMPAGIYACNNKQMLVYWTQTTSGCPLS